MNVLEIRDEIRQQIKAICILTLAVLSIAALMLPGQTGEVGIFFNNVLRMLTGEAAILIPFILLPVGILGIIPWKIPSMRQRILGLLLMFAILLVYAHMRMLLQHQAYIGNAGVTRAYLTLGLQQLGGGVLGGVLTLFFYFLFKDIGSKIILAALIMVAFLLITNISLSQLFRTACLLLFYLSRTAGKGLKAVASFFRFVFAAGSADKDESESHEGNYTDDFLPSPETKAQDSGKAAEAIAGYPPADKPVQDKMSPSPVIRLAERPASTGTLTGDKAANRWDSPHPAKAESYPYAGKTTADPGEYLLPPITLLTQMPYHREAKQRKNIGERAKILEATLGSFGVKAKVTDVQTGPTVTRFELQPEVGVKVSRIVALADDLALNLAAPDVRIEAPIPGKAAVGIEVPNKVIAPVYLREVLEDPQFQNSPSVLTIALGKDITGNPILADLMKMPHLLIAGSTGSGKSVCINVLIATILFKARPQEVKFVMIDPKVVELSTFNGIPHLLMPVVTEPRKASIALKNMLKEMTKRYEIFAAESVRDIHSYNEKKSKQGQDKELLPFIVVIIDELADLMMIAAADVEDSIARLAQMSRAAGIHLVIATQRPSVDVITGVIKANITSRIAFAVSSQADSRTILDIGGAEKLLGRGDALFHPMGTPKPFRIQGAFLNERELMDILSFIKEQSEPQYAEQLIPEEDESDAFYEEDELFYEAVLLVAEAETASISLLQRRLRIGYTRAARLIDDMEKRGFVGRFEGSKAREVLITPEQARKILGEDQYQ